MKTVGIMTLKQVQALAKDIAESAHESMKVNVRESSSTLVVDSARGPLLRAVWRIKKECHVMAVEGLITKE